MPTGQALPSASLESQRRRLHIGISNLLTLTGPYDASLSLDTRGRVRRIYDSRSPLAAYGVLAVRFV